ncbi:MAG: hypothetical protein J1F28_04340 [Oscillospiraceae bacterium]|nr:hypothetical protein [Oscillospiraceae bacterium]
MNKHTFIREKSLERYGCSYKEVEWFEYSEEEQQAVRQTRRTRTRASPPKIKRLNDERSRKYFRWLLHNNFGKGDYHVTLTFKHEPTKEQGQKEFSNFIRRVRRLYDKANIEFKYLYVCEGRRSGSRLHYHLICNSGVLRDDIESKWKLGLANTDRLQPDANDGLYALSRYLVKSKASAEKYERSWNCSANLKRPDEVTDDNSVSRKRMHKAQDAKRNDEVKRTIERIYIGWSVIDYDIGANPVTGRPYARFKLMRKRKYKRYLSLYKAIKRKGKLL